MTHQAVTSQLYIDGDWVPASTDTTLSVENPSTEEIIGHIAGAAGADADRAVRAAARAFPAWSQTPAKERGQLLRAVRDGLEARGDEVADMITREVGTPRRLSGAIQVGLPLTSFATAADLAETMDVTEEVGNSLLVREPVGVVVAITPWNYPLHQIAAKVAYAMAAGCTIVLKPSEIAPLNAIALAEIFHAAGVPAGVFNMVTGTGPGVGEELVSHPLTDMVSFTGSVRAGRRVAELAAAGIKRVALELGGKSANVILDDADLAKAVPAGLSDCYLNSGQTCSALTRMVVPRARLGEVEELALAAVARFTPGDPFDKATRLGPVVSSAQRSRVRGYITKAVDEGARLVAGGVEAPDGLERGYFVRPTVLSDVAQGSTVAQEEVFGPVLAILAHDGDDDALAIANNSSYGLSGGVWSADPDRALGVARRMRTGQVAVNGGAFNPVAPFGGFKHSGVGREYGHYGLSEFLEVKAIQR